MSSRVLSTTFRRFSRRFAAVTEHSAEASSRGPKLPIGNDPASFHSRDHAVNDTFRWRLISAVFAFPVTGYFVIQVMSPHEHNEPPPEYPYLKIASRSPRFPWGEDDLIGTSYERHAKEHGDGDGH